MGKAPPCGLHYGPLQTFPAGHSPLAQSYSRLVVIALALRWGERSALQLTSWPFFQLARERDNSLLLLDGYPDLQTPRIGMGRNFAGRLYTCGLPRDLETS